jgi:FkbM family methyltransferase
MEAKMSIKLTILSMIFKIYRMIFVRKIFIKFNRILYRLSLNGLGILNYQNNKLSGENYFLKKYLKDKTTNIIFDIGANKGSYSKKIMELNPNAELYAFEPHPKTFKKLQEVADEFSFKAFNVGVGDKNETLKIYDYKYKDGSQHASIFKDIIEKVHKSEFIEHKINLIKIDDFCKNSNIAKINLLKIDAEGNELNILMGAVELIKNNKIDIIHFEFNEMNVYSRVFFRDFYELLVNYNFYRMLPDGLIFLGDYNPIYQEIFAYQNIVAIRKDLKYYF